MPVLVVQPLQCFRLLCHAKLTGICSGKAAAAYAEGLENSKCQTKEPKFCTARRFEASLDSLQQWHQTI